MSPWYERQADFDAESGADEEERERRGIRPADHANRVSRSKEAVALREAAVAFGDWWRVPPREASDDEGRRRNDALLAAASAYARVAATAAQETDLDAIEAAAKAATPGPWVNVKVGNGLHVAAGPVDVDTKGTMHGGRGGICETDDMDFGERAAKRNARFVAAANPAIVLALVAEVRRLRALAVGTAIAREIAAAERAALERAASLFDQDEQEARLEADRASRRCDHQDAAVLYKSARDSAADAARIRALAAEVSS